MATYTIYRFFLRAEHGRQIVKTGLTLEEAQKHCQDPETSSKTAKGPEARISTILRGPWFDGYQEE